MDNLLTLSPDLSTGLPNAGGHPDKSQQPPGSSPPLPPPTALQLWPLANDVAERGRSLRIVLMGAEQTASQVEERVVGNAALRVVGRLEAAESEQPVYGWLTGTMRRRSTLLQPGTMMVAQPEVPVPLVVRFPFPAWATRSSEVGG